MSEAADPYIRAIQRKNGKIIIRAMMEIKKVTFEAIVGKICKDYNIFHDKKSVERCVGNFLSSGYYSGVISVHCDKTYSFNLLIMRGVESSEGVEPQQKPVGTKRTCQSSCQPETSAKRSKSGPHS